MATRNTLPSMRDPNRDLQISRPSTLTNGYRALSLTPAPSILAKRTISEDCTQGPDSERPRKYHCLQKEAERRAIPRLDHLKKPAVGLSTGRSSARPFTTGLKPLNPLSIPGHAPPPPTRSLVEYLDKWYNEATWAHTDSTKKSEASERTGHEDAISPWYRAHMHPSPDTEDGKETLKHSFGNTTWPTEAGGSKRAQGKDRVYKCVICLGRAQMNQGSFIRHVHDQHYPSQYYGCPDCKADSVEISFRRRDQLQEHMRHQHGYRLQSEEVKRSTFTLNPPGGCTLCSSPIGSWDEFLECLCRHCLVSKADQGDGGYSEGDDGKEGELVTREFSHNARSDHRD